MTNRSSATPERLLSNLEHALMSLLALSPNQETIPVDTHVLEQWARGVEAARVGLEARVPRGLVAVTGIMLGAILALAPCVFWWH